MVNTPLLSLLVRRLEMQEPLTLASVVSRLHYRPPVTHSIAIQLLILALAVTLRGLYGWLIAGDGGASGAGDNSLQCAHAHHCLCSSLVRY